MASCRVESVTDAHVTIWVRRNIDVDEAAADARDIVHRNVYKKVPSNL